MVARFEFDDVYCGHVKTSKDRQTAKDQVALAQDGETTYG
ncbi:MAG: hypothetical protein Athens041674_913 [Parcubacteria group bacterium Athens0416_74]|nr:MAG: hypothetical protein Athens041674_913 [Parcubacteria group bacterium Athens0416_74]